MATTKRVTEAMGWVTCCRCHERVQPGQFAQRERSQWWHSDASACHPAPVASVPAEPASEPADTRRRNRYPGTCECGRHVPAGRGFLEDDGGWRVFCGGCGLSATVG